MLCHVFLTIVVAFENTSANILCWGWHRSENEWSNVARLGIVQDWCRQDDLPPFAWFSRKFKVTPKMNS